MEGCEVAGKNMNIIDKWIFNSIDLEEPQEKHRRYLGNIILNSPKGYVLCHFKQLDGTYTEELVKVNKDGYGFTKFGKNILFETDKKLYIGDI